MFSQEERCVYSNHQLMDVICQLRFPTILAVGAREPVEFQEAVRSAFPRYQVRQEQLPPKMMQLPGQAPKLEPQKSVANHQFLTQDGTYRINLTQDFISLTCSNYTCWEDFARMMDKPLASFIKIYAPSYFERVGLRYLNAFSRKKLGMEDASWKDLLEPQYLGVLAFDDLPEQAYTRCTQDVEAAISGGCWMKLHVGPGMVRRGSDDSDKEVKLIFDLDVFMSGNVPVNLAAGSMQTVHAQAGSLFRGAITDTLHDAML